MAEKNIIRCPICKMIVMGDEGKGYFCASCKITYNSLNITKKPSRKRLVDEFVDYVMSSEGDTYHIESCKYAKRIENPLYVNKNSLQGLKPCKCIRKQS